MMQTRPVVGQMSFDDLIGQYSTNIPAARGHYVYRFWAADGTCLYVGCVGTSWPRAVHERLHEHGLKSSPSRRFMREVAHIDCASFASSKDALAEETHQIAALQPVHNKVGITGRVDRRRKNFVLK
jgi:excinuclease UvrABC nuclease subunit